MDVSTLFNLLKTGKIRFVTLLINFWKCVYRCKYIQVSKPNNWGKCGWAGGRTGGRPDARTPRFGHSDGVFDLFIETHNDPPIQFFKAFLAF